MLSHPLRAIAFLLALAAGAAAHPVAQGAMDFAVTADGIAIRARVSNEEAFVAAAFTGAGNEASDLDALWRRHGEYLREHLHISADGVPLIGRVVAVSPPSTAMPEARIFYELRYDFPAAPPRAVTIRQDVLHEFEFAPGNPWEASYVVRLFNSDALVHEGLLLARGQPLIFDLQEGAPGRSRERGMAGAFLRHGMRHILTGYDHLLFVAALVLATATVWDLVKVVTAFTLAHTFTLALAVLDVVRLPGRVVEPMIAASIVFVALQNLCFPDRSRGMWRLAIAFGFGLFHGLGFAGGLQEVMEGMPTVGILTAIAAFSLGVEIGHQLVALPLFAAVRLAGSGECRAEGHGRIPRWTMRAGSGAICVAGVCYLAAALR